MPISLTTPDSCELTRAVRDLADWQREGGPVQLHPGDVGWFWRYGAAATAAAVRTWRRDGHVLAIGLLDGPVLRMGIAPEADDDEELARAVLADASTPERGVLAHDGTIESRAGALFRRLLSEEGWRDDEPWTSLHRDLGGPVDDGGLRVEVVGPARAAERAAVQRAAFESSTFFEENWRAMAEGPLYGEARCLVAYDDEGAAVAAATVWSAGAGRPGLLEPMGVHREHRGRGYGRAICLAAASALRELGASSATVCTRAANVAAVATYASAGFVELAPVTDFRRDVGGERLVASVPV
ncbi:MAG TPA: GNAT family N-acetyltransferase [Acidimicrobiales bacterium]|nr:GNAT family N-acetyltransferase [Acidimicrobiales bacterium]